MMEPTEASILAGIFIAMMVSLLAAMLLRRIPPSISRNLMLVLMAVTICAAALYICGAFAGDTGYALALTATSDILQLWIIAINFHMILSIGRWTDYARKVTSMALIYLPMSALTVGMAAAFVISPGLFSFENIHGLPNVQMGFSVPVMIPMVNFYALGALVFLAFIPRDGTPQQRLALYLLLTSLLLEEFNYPILIYGRSGIPANSTMHIILASMGLVLSFMVMRGSALILPRKEAPPVKPPEKVIKLLAPGATYLYIGARKETPRETFRDHLMAGREGLWITRKNPKELRRRYELVNTPFIWLTGSTVEGEVCIALGDAGKLSAVINGFISASNLTLDKEHFFSR